ncbi:MAG: RagB/SusD family nutrient uptake outer membrane protein [Bacteroidales bacterium]|nr:RagB/SusD family nutrient uptake outer membrane protein [Bacteroidales bacterium]
MKTKLTYIALAAAALTSVGGYTGCSDILEEEPRSIFTPEFYGTDKGIEGGLIALYQNLRYVYGNMYFYNSLETGTDEYTYAQSADNNFKDADMTPGVSSLTSSSSRSDVLWGNAFSSINAANYLIKNGKAGSVTPALLAEAYFFRAFNYFCLVQTFGGVPLDLGCGKLEPVTETIRLSTRNTVPEVYQQIFADLDYAAKNLPDNPRLTGAVTKNVARFFLSKAYLTFGWWLDNPKDIPTYPECSRTDLDGHDAKWYYENAYTVANEAITNPGPYGLMDTYYEVNLGSNDRNKECMFYADHTETDGFFNGGDLGYAGGNGTEQVTVWAVTWNYCNLRTYKTAEGSILDKDGKETNQTDPCKREAAQWAGRPWTRMAPTQEVFTKYFADKDNDSRFDGTFVTVYRANWNKTDDKTETYYNANLMPVKPGDPILTFVTDEVTATYPDKKLGKSNVGAGEAEGRADWVIDIDHISRLAYPGLWKLGTYRTDNGSGLGQPNGSLTRPFVIAKFSELYLIAAEAAYQCNNIKDACDMINVLRERAGKWSFSNAENKVVDYDRSSQMKVEEKDITIDFILDERMRELFGEGIRWYDLVRTQTWQDRASEYTICNQNQDGAWVNKQTIKRDIQKAHYLRPIPIGQLNSMEMDDSALKAYQNPGY